MAQSEIDGTFKATAEAEGLSAIFKCDPRLPREGKPFLVFELTEESNPEEASRIRPRVHRQAPVKYTPDLVGCFFAADAGTACRDAARFLGHLGDFVAVEGTNVELEFAEVRASESDKGAASAASAGGSSGKGGKKNGSG